MRWRFAHRREAATGRDSRRGPRRRWEAECSRVALVGNGSRVGNGSVVGNRCRGERSFWRERVRVESGSGHHLLDVKAFSAYALIIVEEGEGDGVDGAEDSLDSCGFPGWSELNDILLRGSDRVNTTFGGRGISVAPPGLAWPIGGPSQGCPIASLRVCPGLFSTAPYGSERLRPAARARDRPAVSARNGAAFPACSSKGMASTLLWDGSRHRTGRGYRHGRRAFLPQALVAVEDGEGGGVGG